MDFPQTRSLVASVHDVSPLTWKTTESILAELDGCGVRNRSLLVIPNHHHRGHFLENPGFCSWLRERAVDGDEIVIHGYYHHRARKPGERAVQKMMTRVYTNDEGEFYDMAGEEAYAAVTKAREEFNEAGLAPVGFIAPAWLLSAPAEEALRRAGCEYTTRLGSVLNLRTGALHATQSMVYSVRNGWRRAASLLWNPHLFRRLRTNPLLRVGIHPPDFGHPRIWRQILDSLSRALEDRQAVTYENWLRIFSHGQG